MRRTRLLTVTLLIAMMAAVPVKADIMSQLDKAESILGIDNADKKTIERVSLLEEELGIAEAEGTLADRVSVIENELGIVEETEQLSESETETEAESESMEDSQLIKPSDAFIIERIKNISTILEAEPVTEDHDPNGNLNKQGGYIGCVYFSDSRVDKSKLYIENDNVIDIGTEGGGAIEVYNTKEEAEGRYAYLDALTTSGWGNGSYRVAGTCVIRISDELMASQQSAQTDLIISMLSAKDDAEISEILASAPTEEAIEQKQAEEDMKLAEDEVILYEQDGYRISCFGYSEEDQYYGATMQMRVQNLTHRDVDFSGDESYVNGQKMYTGAFFDVSSGRTSTQKLTISKEDLEAAGIDKIEDISISFDVYDTNDYYTVASIGPLTISIDENGHIVNKVVYRDSATISEVQSLLNAAGYDCGAADGVAGKQTNNMILKFEREHGLSENTDITDELLSVLRGN